MKTNSKILKAVGIALAVALVSSPSAADAWGLPKMFSLDSTWPFRDKDKPQQGIPVRMVGAWTDTVMTQPGQKPQRGFGGRVTFFDKEGKKPILVDGQLVVYAFNEQGREPTDNKPTRRYVFPADQMPMHMSKSEMGASYSFWLPWDEVGGPKTEVSLICRFEPKGGGVVTGEQTHHLLPGPSVPAVASATGIKPPAVPEGVPSHPARQTLEDIKASRNAAQQARLTGYEAMALGGQPVAAANPAMQMATSPERHLQSTTISLPQSYQMPDAAALGAAMQSAGYPPAPQVAPNTLPAQMQMQAAPIRGYSQMAVSAQNPAVMSTQPYVNNQPPIQQQPQMAPAPGPMYPGVQAVAQQPIGTSPMVGQVQQQSYHQPVIQPPMVQSPMMQAPPIRQPQPAMQMQSWQQQPGQAPAAAMSTPAGVMYR